MVCKVYHSSFLQKVKNNGLKNVPQIPTVNNCLDLVNFRNNFNPPERLAPLNFVTCGIGVQPQRTQRRYNTTFLVVKEERRCSETCLLWAIVTGPNLNFSDVTFT